VQVYIAPSRSRPFCRSSTGLRTGEVVIGTVFLLVVVYPGLGFGEAEAAFELLAVDEVVEEGACFGSA
jgi:hypothetical protein